MSTITDAIGTVNDLLRINHDRINGYQKAMEELKPTDADLKTLFSKMISESQGYAEDLNSEIIKLGGTPSKDSTQAGKIYRAWMDIKAAFTGKDRKAILSSCEFGEDAAHEAYQTALSIDSLPPDTRQLINGQESSLKMSHDTIKQLRDTAKV